MGKEREKNTKPKQDSVFKGEHNLAILLSHYLTIDLANSFGSSTTYVCIRSYVRVAGICERDKGH